MKDINKRNEVLLHQKIESVLFDTLKEDPTFIKLQDGSYRYEVSPISGDHLSDAEIQKVQTSHSPSETLLALIGSKYFDVLSAAEQSLFQYVYAKVTQDMADVSEQDIMRIIAPMVDASAPISYYRQQLQISGDGE